MFFCKVQKLFSFSHCSVVIHISQITAARAHPAKFGDAIEKAIGHPPTMPKVLSKLFDKEEKITILDNNTEDLKSLILSNI